MVSEAWEFPKDGHVDGQSKCGKQAWALGQDKIWDTHSSCRFSCLHPIC